MLHLPRNLCRFRVLGKSVTQFDLSLLCSQCFPCSCITYTRSKKRLSCIHRGDHLRILNMRLMYHFVRKDQTFEKIEPTILVFYNMLYLQTSLSAHFLEFIFGFFDRYLRHATKSALVHYREGVLI